MKIRNVRGRTLEIAATGQVVEPDEETEVAAELGKSLCAQPANWSAVKSTAKATKTTTPEEGDES